MHSHPKRSNAIFLSIEAGSHSMVVINCKMMPKLDRHKITHSLKYLNEREKKKRERDSLHALHSPMARASYSVGFLLA